MILCYLGLGSNLKSPERQLRQALAALRKLPRSAVIAVADFYYNPACGKKSQPRFCNTVVALQTYLAPLQLLNQCQRIEKQQGRVRREQWGVRTLDIDILFFGQAYVNTPRLQIPHPRLYQRAFVLIPLAQLLSGKALPCGRNIEKLLL